jgi:outer membrane lipopolysaccharide assembly protein LptE/RlpB
VTPPPLVSVLEDRLRVRGALGADGANAVLRITELNTRRRLLAVSPVDARGAVYELEIEVVFDFHVGGQTRLAHESLTVRREYSFDDTARLAAEAERENLLEAMQAELADLILLSIANSPPLR